MDSLGGSLPASDAAFGLTDEDSVRGMPPAAFGQDERRMQVRAYNFWVSLLNDRSFPSIEDLDPENLPDFGPYSVLLDFTAGIENPAVQFLGEALAEESGSRGEIRYLDDVPSRSLLSRITDHCLQIIANQAPIGFEAEFVNQRGATTLYRGILLPFSSDGETIDFIYGAINWKELADQKITDPLLPEAARHSDMPVGDVELVSSPGHVESMNAEGPTDELPADEMELADWLASARELALAAQGSEDRSRQSLYAAISRAYDFALAAEAQPEAFAELAADAGIAVQKRAPLTPVVKLVFGANYDKTRLAEFAAALGHGRRKGLARGKLAEHITATPGSLKAIVAEERKLRREETGKQSALRTEPGKDLVRRLREREHCPIAEVNSEGAEFALLIARRLPSGEVVLLGEISDDVALLSKAARRLLSGA